LLLRRKISRSDPGFTLAVIFLVQATLFALLLRVKFFNYFIALWPLLALMLAWGGVQLWKRSGGRRLLVAVLLAAIVVEGSVRLAAEHSAARGATPYDAFESRIARVIPPGSRLLGLPQYWLGLRGHDYRSWLLPILMTEPEGGIPLDSAMSRVAPDVVLIDRHMREFLDETSPNTSPRHGLFEGYRRFMRDHRGELLGTVVDSTYGVMEVYGVRR
jgi:hypothetical protein